MGEELEGNGESGRSGNDINKVLTYKIFKRKLQPLLLDIQLLTYLFVLAMVLRIKKLNYKDKRD